jgi:hypothetical protein
VYVNELGQLRLTQAKAFANCSDVCFCECHTHTVILSRPLVNHILRGTTRARQTANPSAAYVLKRAFPEALRTPTRWST